MAENIKILADREDIVAIADAVRAKTGTSGEMTLGGIARGIGDINTGEDPVLQNKTVTPTTSSQTVKPDSGYDGLGQVTVNAIPTATQATPTVSIDTTGKITATTTQAAGYVAAGTKSATKQLTTQAAKTVTPTTSNQTAVASGVYTTGVITVKGDANLKAANIASGVSIFGVTGTHSGAEDLDSIITELETKVTSLNTTLDGKAAGDSYRPEWIDVTALLNVYADDDDGEDGGATSNKSLVIEDDALLCLILADETYTPQAVITRTIFEGTPQWISQPIGNKDYYITDASAASGVNFTFMISYPVGDACYVLPVYNPVQ